MTPQYEVIDKKFRNYVISTAPLTTLASDLLWAEGPVYFADGDFLVWSDIPNDRMLRWIPGLGTGEFRRPSSFANGNTRDREGRLVTCEHGTRRMTRTEHDGSLTVLADRHEGKRLNSPNDVVVKSDGSVWFTDPCYGILSDYEGHKAEQELAGCYVFRIDPARGSLSIVADDFVKPNGLAFSPDEAKLYIVDSGYSHDPGAPRHIRVFGVREGGGLGGGGVFAEVSPGIPDGIRCDGDGNVWCGAGDGIHCYAPNGELLGKMKLPEAVANLTFGGPKRNRLFIAASTHVYSVYVSATGVQYP